MQGILQLKYFKILFGQKFLTSIMLIGIDFLWFLYSIYHLDKIEEDIKKLRDQRDGILGDEKVYDLTHCSSRNPADETLVYNMLERHCRSERRDRRAAQEIAALENTKSTFIGNLKQIQTVYSDR